MGLRGNEVFEQPGVLLMRKGGQQSRWWAQEVEWLVQVKEPSDHNTNK